MLKNLLNRGLCLVGAHDGPWAPTTDPCTQTRACTRCGTHQTQTEHDLGDWLYQEAGRCETHRACARCGWAEEGLAHPWGDALRQPDGCAVTRTCGRCAAVEALAPEHDWAWIWAEATCVQVAACARCGARAERQRLVHAWESWRFDEDAQRPVHRCGRCGTASHEVVADQIERRAAQANEALVQAVDAYLGADDLSQQRALIEQNPALFFSSAMNPFLARALAQFSGHDQLGPALRGLWVLLRNCQQEGLEVGLQLRAVDAAEDVVIALVSAGTWREKQRILLRHPFLYDAQLAPWWETIRRHAPAEHQPVIAAHQTLVQGCREHGVAAMLAELIASEPPPPPPPPPPPRPERDPQLVGLWQHTQVYRSGGFSMSSYSTLRLASGGAFRLTSRSRGGTTFVNSAGHWAGVSSVDSGDSPGEHGQWHVEGGDLILCFSDGTRSRMAGYTCRADSLFFPASSRRLWKRLG